ncbi:MAG: Enoyl-CoA hydratase/isomerase [Frankiales bacterium]|nr:Enoyl-CoA hydratase/isomerase [Frankiales bacterium]
MYNGQMTPADAYSSVRVRQEGGVTEVRFHTDDGPLVWNAAAHGDAAAVFSALAHDRSTKVVIVTGTGDSWCTTRSIGAVGTGWEPIYWEGKRILRSLLDIEVPVIGAVNGPAHYHAEIPLLGDIVLASDTAEFADFSHFTTGAVPGDGVQLVWPWLVGHRRAKYFLMMREVIKVEEARRIGFVNEVLPPDQLLPRAWEIARTWAAKPLPLLRYSREALNTFERQYLLSGLAGGLALEGLAYAESPPAPDNLPTDG